MKGFFSQIIILSKFLIPLLMALLIDKVFTSLHHQWLSPQGSMVYLHKHKSLTYVHI